MRISEQVVKELRDCVRKYQEFENIPSSEPFKLHNQAADTIESLSAKLTEKSEELKRCHEAFDCDGEWIYCGDKDNLPIESGEYRAIFNGADIFGNFNFDSSDTTWYEDNGQYCDVIAWWKECPYES